MKAIEIPTAEQILEPLRPYGSATKKVWVISGVEVVLYPVGELAKALNRRPGTLRKWEEYAVIPTAPVVLRGDGPYANRRLYTGQHVVGMVTIAAEEGILEPRVGPPIKDTQFVPRVRALFRMLVSSK